LFTFAKKGGGKRGSVKQRTKSRETKGSMWGPKKILRTTARDYKPTYWSDHLSVERKGKQKEVYPAIAKS